MLFVVDAIRIAHHLQAVAFGVIRPKIAVFILWQHILRRKVQQRCDCFDYANLDAVVHFPIFLRFENVRLARINDHLNRALSHVAHFPIVQAGQRNVSELRVICCGERGQRFICQFCAVLIIVWQECDQRPRRIRGIDKRVHVHDAVAPRILKNVVDKVLSLFVLKLSRCDDQKLLLLIVLQGDGARRSVYPIAERSTGIREFI